ncbi:hypothetical protein MC885_021762 [Smutsia gigantea]|nr:hypothetical protein MC885_021762 [Smutsia gigantea]
MVAKVAATPFVQPSVMSRTTEIPTSQPDSKSNGGTKSGHQQISQGNQSSSPQSSDILGKESEAPGTTDPVPIASINGEKPQELSPSGVPAKKPLPCRRGVRRGDVLLMVAKLDPDSAKLEQKPEPHAAPTCKIPLPATDPGGAPKGGTPGTPRGPQASTEDATLTAEKTQTGGLRDPGTVLRTKGEKDQGTAGKGGGVPQIRGLKGDVPQGKEGPDEGGQLGTLEKRVGDPPSKKAKENLSKDVGGEGKWAGVRIQVRKWGGSLGRRSKWDGPQSKKDKEGELLSKAKKTEESKAEAEKMGKVLGKVGKVGEAPTVMEKAWDPPAVPGPQGVTGEGGRPQSESAEAGKAGNKTENGCKAPKEVETHGETPVAAGKEGQLDSRGQKAEEPSAKADNGAEALESELEGPRQPALESKAERPQAQENQEGPALQEGDEGGQSRASDQAPEDRWYEAEKVWLVQKDGFTLATVLKPDEGTADLPVGKVRLCIDADKTITEVDEDHVHRGSMQMGY